MSGVKIYRLLQFNITTILLSLFFDVKTLVIKFNIRTTDALLTAEYPSRVNRNHVLATAVVCGLGGGGGGDG